MRMHSSFTAFLASSLCIAPLANANEMPPIGTVFKDIKTGEPGCSAGIMRRGQLTWSGGFGSAIMESRAPITADTIFNIASVSKQFTAFSILQLEAEGKLALDDSIRRFLPELPAYAQDVKIRHLLHHTGGLQDYILLAGLSGVELSQRLTKEQAFDLTVRQNSAMFPAGTEYSYSNTGYFLLSMIIERVSGQTFKEYAEAKIFRPLGMTHSTILDHYPLDIPQAAEAYEQSRNGAPFEMVEAAWEPTGDGQVYTNVGDLLIWLRNLDTGEVGGKALVAKMLQTDLLADGDRNPYAMGLSTGSYRGLQQIAHSGGWAGYNSFVAWYPTADLAVVTLCNASERDASARVQAIVDMLFSSGQLQPGKEASGPPPSIEAAAKAPVAKLLTGLYADKSGRMLALRRVQSGFALDTFGSVERLSKQSDMLLVASDDGSPFYYGATPEGDLVASNPASVYHRVPAWRPREIESYVGTYRLETTPGQVQVYAKDGKLFGKTGEDSFLLTPLSVDRFGARELGVVSFSPDRGSFTTSLARNLRFIKSPSLTFRGGCRRALRRRDARNLERRDLLSLGGARPSYPPRTKASHCIINFRRFSNRSER